MAMTMEKPDMEDEIFWQVRDLIENGKATAGEQKAIIRTALRKEKLKRDLKKQIQGEIQQQRRNV